MRAIAAEDADMRKDSFDNQKLIAGTQGVVMNAR
jgi:hypothetical protein